MSSDFQAILGYTGLILVATTSVYAGSQGSLPKTRSKSRSDSTKEEDEEDEEPHIPHLTSDDAWLFPVLGSAVLGGLYLIIKFLGPEWINWLMSNYLSFAALYGVSDTILKLSRNIVGQRRWKTFSQYRFKFERGKQLVASCSWRAPSFFLVPLGTLPVILYRLQSGKKSAVLTNIMALSFAHEAMALMKLDSWKTGCILLSGLFLYDIWWVFGTKVMVSVATSLDVPIKLLWPRAVFDSSKGLMMLGLGDVVVPGIFVALALRYDHSRATAGNVKMLHHYPTPYFNAALFAYAIGLVITMAVMHIFKAAQPALLYLSPSCILSFLITAMIQKDLGTAWNWVDGGNDDTSQSGADTKAVGATDAKKTQ